MFTEDRLVDSFEYEFFTAKAKIKYTEGSKKIKGAVNVRMEQDKQIWMSVSPALNVEVSRILLNEDSIHVLDRMNKRYYRISYAEISRIYKMDVDFEMIQSILVGNLVFPFRRDVVKSVEGGKLYRKENGAILFEHYIGNKTKKLEDLRVIDSQTGNELSVHYEDFRAVEDQNFPFLINTLISPIKKNGKKVNVEIAFSKAQVSEKPIKFPFNVPSKYESL